MAETSVQKEVASWICESFLPKHYGTSFSRQRVSLSCGGEHSFAAVGETGSTVGTICTATAGRPSGGLAVGKVNKVRADLYFLLLARCDRRFVAITQPIMYQFLKAEQEVYRRIPADVEVLRVILPRHLQEKLEQARTSTELAPA